MAKRKTSRKPSTLAARVRELRTDKGLTILALAAAADLATDTIIDVEHGRGKPARKTIDSLARALRVSAEELRSGE